LAATASGPARFRALTGRARRDRDASRAAVAVLKADSLVGRTLERALGEAGLTLPQFNVLMELAATPDAALPLHELTSRLISSPPNVSWLSSRMEQTGLVVKTKDPRDARVVLLSLTEGGWAALERATPLVFAAERQLLAGYTREELRALVSLLDRLVAPSS
jgi:DNA-binding MarR family transcriptional regulator